MNFQARSFYQFSSWCFTVVRFNTVSVNVCSKTRLSHASVTHGNSLVPASLQTKFNFN